MLAVGMPSSLLPRPKPLTIGPESWIGKGLQVESGGDLGAWGSKGGSSCERSSVKNRKDVVISSDDVKRRPIEIGG